MADLTSNEFKTQDINIVDGDGHLLDVTPSGHIPIDIYSSGTGPVDVVTNGNDKS